MEDSRDGAIDLDLLFSDPAPPPPKPAPPIKVELASKLEYRRVDEVWDDKAGKYMLVDLVDSQGDEELDQYVFVVRGRTDRTLQTTTTYVDIKSSYIRDFLKKACRDIRGVSLQSRKPSIEQNTLFHIRHEIKQLLELSEENPRNTTATSHLRLFVDYLDTAFPPVTENLSALLAKGEITYDLLWALFKPNAEVYTTCKGTGAPRCVLFSHCEEQREMGGARYMYLETRYIHYDGKVLGEVTASAKIPYFLGTKPIEHLGAYPLRYHAERDEIRKRLVQYGRTFVSLMGVQHCQYQGKAFYIDTKHDNSIESRHIRKGRIIVDAICFQEQMPNYPCPRIQKARPRYSGNNSTKPCGISPGEVEEWQFLICSPTVFGFCLNSKQFFEFAVSNISDIEWSPSSFNDVKIPEKQKTSIWALTATYLNRELDNSFRDLVQGKGRGINFLLYGPPGVGKTLTVEMLAETFKVPLYTVPAGQIGTDPVQVERVLTTIFTIANRWKAILLLDEADVFLSQRSRDPHLSALVSVFLRELEQYEGILFLTTNRVQTFDEAMISRIHLALKYGPLSQDARKGVWKYFLTQARTTSGIPACDEKQLDELAKKELNGREIRNIVFVARSVAEYEGTVVSRAHLDDSIGMRKQFFNDFCGVGAVENLSSYV